MAAREWAPSVLPSSERIRFAVSSRATLPVLLIVSGLVVAYWAVALKLVRDWAANDDYSHGFLIVPLALYFAWERRDRVASTASRPSNLGFVVLLAGLAALAVGVLGAELFLARVSLIAVIVGIVLFVCGWQHLRVLAFPIAFLLLMIPIPMIIFNQVAFPLQLLASRVGETVLWSAGIPVLREGNVITLASTSLEVAEACSGIRSLVSLLTLAVVYTHFSEGRRSVRALLTISTLPIAILTNGLRVAAIGIAVHLTGPDAAEGLFHTVSGWLVFISAFACLLLLHRLTRIRIDRLRPRAVPASVTVSPPEEPERCS